MPLPILGWAAVAAATATVAYLASDDDSSSSSSDRDTREKETKQRAKEERNERIREEINEYKENQSSQIEEKYGAIISFDLQEDLKVLSASFEGRTEYEDINKASKVQIMYQDRTRQYEIDDLKKQIIELEESIKELEAIKNETLK
jgi:hypothetical protein